MGIYIVMYHYTRDLKRSRYPNMKGLDISLFRQQIEYFDSYFHIVNMEQVIAASRNEVSLPTNALLLTFDDGYIDNYTCVLPILEKYGIQGTFFIPGKVVATHQLLDVNKIHFIFASTNVENLIDDVFERLDYYRGKEFDYPSNEELFDKYAVANRWDSKETIFIKRILQLAVPERLRKLLIVDLFQRHVGTSEEQLAYETYMSEDQVRALKRHGMYIGIHGYDHYWLSNLSEDELRMDIKESLMVMDEFVDCKSWVMSYPYGNYSQRVVEYIKQKGAVLAMTIEARAADLNADSHWELPRFDCNDFPPKSDNYLKL